MRSHPSTTPPPLPAPFDALVFDLSSVLPNQSQPSPLSSHRGRASSLDLPLELELAPLNPDTSRLLPPRTTTKRHHVRVQGKLVVVRSISTANLKPGVGGSAPASPLPVGVAAPLVTPRSAGGQERRESLGGRGRGSPLGNTTRISGRRRSLDDVGTAGMESEGEAEEEVREVVVRDRQLRGYGIGGAGNIREFFFPTWRGFVLTCGQDGRRMLPTLRIRIGSGGISGRYWG
ncbi:hypothetical protein B0T14DRAFT_339115 [Immersiella caudata]|uniref:Uncharacterized protein n=1 Tax=Immersiella caudata TaxID=314043 RepID=A0AA39U551_9PEZI|nr:hypothetical protein B0T14DRAFT_339115 [Immersiella caudata]